MALPKEFVERNLEKAKGCIFYGVPLEDLTREELMACASAGWDINRTTACQPSDYLNSQEIK